MLFARIDSDKEEIYNASNSLYVYIRHVLYCLLLTKKNVWEDLLYYKKKKIRCCD